MKKTGIILTTFALTMLWGQKEILSVTTDQVISLSDRDNNSAVVDIDPAMIQEIRTVKKSMDKLHIKRQMMKAVPSGPRSFKVSNSESRFTDVQKIIEQIKEESQTNISSSIDILPNKNVMMNKVNQVMNQVHRNTGFLREAGLGEDFSLRIYPGHRYHNFPGTAVVYRNVNMFSVLR